MRVRMQSSDTGRRLLRERPRVADDRISVQRLRSMPKDSFGYAYAQVGGLSLTSPPMLSFTH